MLSVVGRGGPFAPPARCSTLTCLELVKLAVWRSGSVVSCTKEVSLLHVRPKPG